MRIEAIFGGILSLFVLGVVVFAVMSGKFGRGGGGGGDYEQAAGDRPQMTVCGCFNNGFSLANNRYDVLSPEYATQFVLCREVLGEEGGSAFTAGWNAQRHANPWEASCEAWQERRGA